MVPYMVETKQVNWVKERTECTIANAFESIVCQIIADVDTFNSLQEEKNQNRRIGYESCGSSLIMTDSLSTSNQVLVKLDKEAKKIEVRDRKKSSPRVVITQQWNKTKLVCELLIGGKVVDLWQISQEAVGDLLFP